MKPFFMAYIVEEDEIVAVLRDVEEEIPFGRRVPICRDCFIAEDILVADEFYAIIEVSRSWSEKLIDAWVGFRLEWAMLSPMYRALLVLGVANLATLVILGYVTIRN